MRGNQSKGSSSPDPFCDGSHLGPLRVQTPGVVTATGPGLGAVLGISPGNRINSGINSGINYLTTRRGLPKSGRFAWNAFWNCLKHSHLMARPAAWAGAMLLLIGTAKLRGQNVAGLTQLETSKRWTITANVGMFYDDNNLSSPTDPQGSFGFEFDPHIAVNLPLARTVLKASYDLRLNYYEARTSDNTDREHQFAGEINHRFTELSTLDVSETYIRSTQPEVMGGNAQTTFLRGNLGHWRNYFRSDYTVRLAPTYGMSMGLRNDWFAYDQSGFAGSLSSSLDRSDTRVHVEGHYYANERSRYFAGYQIGFLEYTSSDDLGTLPAAEPPFVTIIPASYRSSRAHSFYVGFDRRFSPRMTASTSVGASYTDYYNQNFAGWSPYLQMRGTLQLLPGTALEAGAQVSQTATDSGVGQTGVTRDQLSTVFDVRAGHRLTPRLQATVTFFFQHSIYNGGDFDGQADDNYEVVPGLEYKITENLYTRVDYTRQELFSSRPLSSFTRNRIFVGMRVAF